MARYGFEPTASAGRRRRHPAPHLPVRDDRARRSRHGVRPPPRIAHGSPLPGAASSSTNSFATTPEARCVLHCRTEPPPHRTFSPTEGATHDRITDTITASDLTLADIVTTCTLARPRARRPRPRLLLRRCDHTRRRVQHQRPRCRHGDRANSPCRDRGAADDVVDDGSRPARRPSRVDPPRIPVGGAAATVGTGRQGRRGPRRTPPRTRSDQRLLLDDPRRSRTPPHEGRTRAVPDDPRTRHSQHRRVVPLRVTAQPDLGDARANTTPSATCSANSANSPTATTPPADGCGSYQALFAGLEQLEADTHLHIHKENNLLFPAVVQVEQRLSE